MLCFTSNCCFTTNIALTFASHESPKFLPRYIYIQQSVHKRQSGAVQSIPEQSWAVKGSPEQQHRKAGIITNSVTYLEMSKCLGWISWLKSRLHYQKS